MPVENLNSNKICCFCASDFHLEMILLPYIKERLNTSKFIIITENNLEETIKFLLNKLNLKEEIKKEILQIGWNKTVKISKETIDKLLKENKEITIIINGEYNFIKQKNNEIKNFIDKKINIIDCFHDGDPNIDIDKKKEEYKNILNTKRL